MPVDETYAGRILGEWRVRHTAPAASRKRGEQEPMTTWGQGGRESGCAECSNDHHHTCSRAVKDDAGGWSTVHCCCGLAVEDHGGRGGEYAAYAEELRGLGWSQPAGPNPRPKGSG